MATIATQYTLQAALHCRPTLNYGTSRAAHGMHFHDPLANVSVSMPPSSRVAPPITALHVRRGAFAYPTFAPESMARRRRAHQNDQYVCIYRTAIHVLRH
eukprot:IDg11951t1